MTLAAARLRNRPSAAALTRQTKTGPVWTGEVIANEQWPDQLLQWIKPNAILIMGPGDWFHEAFLSEWVRRVFAAMRSAPWN